MEKHYIIDFDSTFIQTEALDELAALSLSEFENREQVIEQIKAITASGMAGDIAFDQSLSQRLALLGANKKQVQKLISFLQKKISLSIKQNKDFFKAKAENIFIISGGFKEIIWPIVKPFGLKVENVFANDFVYDSSGKIIGADKNNYLAQDKGKIKQLAELRLPGKIYVLGDGYTDYEMKSLGVAHIFVAFIENIRREKVVAVADKVVENFNQFINYTYE